MLTQITALALTICMALVSAVQHAGHLCDVEGPVMGPDCCCGDEEAERFEGRSQLDLPGCCDGTVDVVSHLGVSSAEQGSFVLALAFPSLAILDVVRVGLTGPSSNCWSRLRAPPDSNRVPVYLRNQRFLI